MRKINLSRRFTALCCFTGLTCAFLLLSQNQDQADSLFGSIKPHSPGLSNLNSGSDHPLPQILPNPVDPKDPSTRYLAYFPHSGYNNQRIELENALVLARLSNRTLLVPPVRIPFGTFWSPVGSLREHWESVVDCVHRSQEPWPSACGPLLPWSLFVELSALERHQTLMNRTEMSDKWLRDTLGLSLDSSDTFTFVDTARYHFLFFDNVPPSGYFKLPGSTPTPLHDLLDRDERLVQFGSTYSNRKLYLTTPAHVEVRAAAKRAMALTNPTLHAAAQAVHDAIGGSFISTHIRLDGPVFEDKTAALVRVVWWRLLCEALGIKPALAAEIERELVPGTPPDATAPDYKFDTSNAAPGISAKRVCPRPLHTAAHLLALNAPLYIATDVRVSDPSLDRILRTFPCAFFLDDFMHPPADALTALDTPKASLPPRKYLLPFVDALVAARGDAFVGTVGSTFSTFISKVLWRVDKGLSVDDYFGDDYE